MGNQKEVDWEGTLFLGKVSIHEKNEDCVDIFHRNFTFFSDLIYLFFTPSVQLLIRDG